MKSYADISKKLIVEALGPAKNHTEHVTTDKIDVEKSSCMNCIHYIRCMGNHNLSGACAICDTKTYEIKTIYKNKKNQYGVRDRYRLKSTALRLLIYLHFLNPDTNGIIKNVDFKELAAVLNVHPKTIIYNIHLLTDYGYICYCNCSKGRYNVLIEGYKDQGMTHGSDYIVVNEEWLTRILVATDINCLRIIIMETEKIDDLNVNEKSIINTITNSYDEICRYLPKYVKPWHIRKSLKSCTEAIEGVFETVVLNDSIRFTLKDSCSTKKIRSKQKESNETSELAVKKSNVFGNVDMTVELAKEITDIVLCFDKLQRIVLSENFDTKVISAAYNLYQQLQVQEDFVSWFENLRK